MQAMRFDLPSSARLLGFLAFIVLLTSCDSQRPRPPIALKIQQQWQLQPGDSVAGYRVASGLGDIAIELSGQWLYMPMSGKIQPLDAESGRGCALFSSPELPAYYLRICGLKQVRWGDRQPGDPIGKGDRVSLGMLRKQTDGTWAMVEPATKLLEQFFKTP